MIPIQPMLVGRADSVVVDPRYRFEIKYDGYRAILEVTREREVRVWSRHGRELTQRVPELQRIAEVVRRPCVLDGELVVLDEHGYPRFEWMMGRKAHTFVAFDMLRDKHKMLLGVPWLERTNMLTRTVCEESAEIHVARSVADGQSLFAECERRCIEGVVAKRTDSFYRAGERATSEWLKIKTSYGKRVTRARMIAAV